jgi:hypothetical protein
MAQPRIAESRSGLTQVAVTAATLRLCPKGLKAWRWRLRSLHGSRYDPGSGLDLFDWDVQSIDGAKVVVDGEHPPLLWTRRLPGQDRGVVPIDFIHRHSPVPWIVMQGLARGSIKEFGCDHFDEIRSASHGAPLFHVERRVVIADLIQHGARTRVKNGATLLKYFVLLEEYIGVR